MKPPFLRRNSSSRLTELDRGNRRAKPFASEPRGEGQLERQAAQIRRLQSFAVHRTRSEPQPRMVHPTSPGGLAVKFNLKNRPRWIKKLYTNQRIEEILEEWFEGFEKELRERERQIIEGEKEPSELYLLFNILGEEK